MAITLPPDAHKQAIASLKRYATESLDEELGDLKAGLLLVGSDPMSIEAVGIAGHDPGCSRSGIPIELHGSDPFRNRAIRDAQIYIQDRASDLEGVCVEKEFGYWFQPPTNPRRK